ncbi:MAG: peptidoglycan DD-metalloendopeptidase family protein [Pseudomonadota bacterium]
MPSESRQRRARAGVRTVALGAALAALLALGWPGAPAQAAARHTERSKQKAAAEAARAGIAQKLSALKRDIGRTESEKEHAADTLAASEEAISDARRNLLELSEEQSKTNLKLGELAASGGQVRATIEAQKAQLAKLLREQYVAGNEDRIKLLLSGDNPNRINRDLQLMAYVSQAQARLLTALRANLAAVETNQQEAQNARDELEEIAQEEREQQAVLEKEKARRAQLLGSLSKRLAAQRKEAGNLAQDEQRMGELVDKLAKLIQEQAAAAAAAEQRRLETLAAAKAAKARAKTERERLAKAQAQAKALAKNGGAPSAPSASEGVEAKLAQQASEKAEQEAREAQRKVTELTALAPAVPDGAFARLRGLLRAPADGKVIAKFGSKNADGATWKGMLIRAPEGADVHAVAPGRVIFADWRRGLGNLIIIDHGGNYWSIYGYNQALLKREGDSVKAGELVASAGNTGGVGESALYFQLRHQGSPIDPAGWIKFQ